MTKPDEDDYEEPFSFTIEQDGIEVVMGGGSVMEAVRAEALHYANVYVQDGPIILRVKGFALPPLYTPSGEG